MSLPSKSLVAALRVRHHDDKTLKVLRDEYQRATIAEEDGRIRTYRVIACLTSSHLRGSNDPRDTYTNADIWRALETDRETLSAARISQVKASAALAIAFGLDIATDDTRIIADYWRHLDAIRRAGKNFLRDVLGADTWSEAIEAIRATADGGDQASTLEVLAAIGDIARSANTGKAARAKGSRSSTASTATTSPQGDGDGSGGTGGKAPAPSAPDTPATDTTGDDLVAALEAAMRLAADTDLASKMSPDQHARACDLVAMITDRLHEAGDAVPA